VTELPPLDGARLWLVDLDGGSAFDDWLCLDADEQARAARFVFEHHRRRYIAAHSALRRLLAAHTGRALEQVRYRIGEFGKPHLLDGTPCSFNLSHSEDVGLIGIADIGDNGEIGVDVEVLRPVLDASALAADNFTGPEQGTLSAANASERDLVFFWGWTRKEACLKAIGSGLSIRPDSFEVGLNGGIRDVTIQTPQKSATVRVQSFRHGPRVLGALARTVDCYSAARLTPT
jgi:4'-phosphopantetheinyl transferase